VSSIVDRFGLHDPNYSLDEMKFGGNQNIPSFQPRSFPEYTDGLANDCSYNSFSPVPGMASNIASMMNATMDNRHIQGLSSDGNRLEQNGVFVSSGNGSSSVLHGSNWNNPNLRQQRPTGPIMWPTNSPTLVNSIHTHRNIPHAPGFSRVPLMSLSVHHIGSAPTIDHSLWDRRHAYPGESPETSAFHLGSLGSIGFPGSSPSRSMEIASRNMFSHGGMGLTKSPEIPSPQQMCQIFPGRNPMAASFDSPGERVRNLTHRRSESNFNNADKKQYELDIDRILHGKDNRTTLMIKNIPNKYTSKMLLTAIDEHCRGTYDFIYLPIDFKNKCNVGYAFINMINPSHIIPFYKAFNGKKWEKFNSEKVASLAYARIQGKNALVVHFQNSSLMNEDKRCRPILFHTEGPNAGDQEPFPTGACIRSRPGKTRTSGNEENLHQVNSPDDFLNGSDSSSNSSKEYD
jgi:RNA recognition motif-containing protein